MTSFKHSRNNAYRYNTYESYDEVEINSKNNYETIRNTLFFIALILSVSVTSLISYDSYKEGVKANSALISINPEEDYQEKKIENKLRGEVSKLVITQLKLQNKLNEINERHVTVIVTNVMEKIKHSPNQIIYTQQ